MSEPVVPPQVTPPAAPPATPPATPPETPPATPPTPPAAPPATPTPPPEEKIDPPVGTVDPETGEYVIPEDLDTMDSKKVKEAIDKSVQAGISKATGAIAVQRINNEVKDIIAAHPEYEPYKERITKWVNHPNRLKFIKNGFPVQSVVLEAIAPHLEKIGAEKMKAAIAKAKASEANGGTPPATVATTKVDYKSMSTKDIEEMAEKVKSGRV